MPEVFTSLMLVGPDARRDYGETRKIGFGFIRGRLMAVAFTERKPNLIRIISARKANKREEAYYQEAVADELGKN
ncbi:MAG: BrnT family toxin [Nitrospirota bacterium]